MGQKLHGPATDRLHQLPPSTSVSFAVLIDTYERYGASDPRRFRRSFLIFNMGILEAVEGYLGEEVKLHKALRAGRKLATSATNPASPQPAGCRRDRRGVLSCSTPAARLRLQGRIATHRPLPGAAFSHRLRSMVIGQLGLTPTPPSTISEKALDIRTAADAEASDGRKPLPPRCTRAATPTFLPARYVRRPGRPRQACRRPLRFVQPAYRFVDSGYIVLELSDEVEPGSGPRQELPDAVESVAPGDGPRHRRHHPRRRQGALEKLQIAQRWDPLPDNSRSPAASLAHCTRLPWLRISGRSHRYDKLQRPALFVLH